MDLRFVIITGISGAGKSEAVRCFEDLGYFCVDNLPPALIPKFADFCLQSAGTLRRIALVSDIRGGRFFDSLSDALAGLETAGIPYRILFLEASDEVLVQRFKASRRRHPLSPEGGVLDGIRSERHRLEGLRGRAQHVIDTSNRKPQELRAMIERLYGDQASPHLAVSIVSFGFKWGLPLDADMVQDVRFLPNPHYVASLKEYTGNDPAVVDYVFQWPLTKRFLDRLTDLVDFLLPEYVDEGKRHLMIAIGCTGGQHRSVAIANRLGEHVREAGYTVRIEHRDLQRAAS